MRSCHPCTAKGEPWHLNDPGVSARILYRNGIWPSSKKAIVENKCNKGEGQGGHGAAFVAAKYSPGCVGIAKPVAVEELESGGEEDENDEDEDDEADEEDEDEEEEADDDAEDLDDVPA